MRHHDNGTATSSPVADETVSEFLDESYEGLERATLDVMAMNSGPSRSDGLSQFKRAIHTIKGTCGCLGYPHLETFAHEVESFVAQDPEDGAAVQHLSRILLNSLETIRETLTRIESTGSEMHAQLEAATAELRDLKTNAARNSKPKTISRPTTIGEILISKGLVTQADIEEALEQQMSGDPLTIGEILVEKGKVKASDVREALKSQQKKKAVAIADSKIRVDIDLLDDLLELITELGITRNRIIQRSEDLSDSKLITASQRLNLLTEDLQTAGLKLRMQPADQAWKSLPKQVMELSRRSKKKVLLKTAGGDTEIDRAILDAIKEPLVHLVRNAIDHGLESPQERVRVGKDPAGTITLEAKRSRGKIEISVRDNGRGLDLAKIVEKAVSQELLTQHQADQMTPDEILRLILLPGFSTKSDVNYVSGRGVGMDIVHTNIEKIGGTIDIENFVGEGVNYVMRFPQDVKAVPVLLVTISGETYGVHRDNLLEILRLEKKSDLCTIEGPGGANFFRLRDQVLPLVDLHSHLNGSKSDVASVYAATPAPEAEAQVVIVQSDEMPYGLLVDDVIDTEEVVLRPMAASRRDLPIFFGSCVLEDGRNADLIDVTAVAESTQSFSDASILIDLPETDSPSSVKWAPDTERIPSLRERTILIVDDARAIRSFVKLVLVQGGGHYRILEAENGADALAIMYKTQVDLVILDFDMPVMNGIQLAGQVRQDKTLRDVKIIMLSARSYEQDRVAGLDAGADEYVTKPIKPAELLARTRAMLRITDLQEELVDLERKRHEARIEMAREVQQSLLPQQTPLFNEIDFSLNYSPSEGLGGDFYDYVYGDSNQFSLIVGDAEGHGIRASLLMAQASAFLRATVNSGLLSPSELIESMNRLICRQKTLTSLLPMVCFSFDFDKGCVRYVNAGHVPSLLYSCTERKWLTLSSTAPLLGIDEDLVFEESEFPINDGDIFVCFTDGLNEAFDTKGDQFGIGQISSLIESSRHSSADEIVKNIVSVWSRYETGEGCDDMTLIVTKIQRSRPVLAASALGDELKLLI